MTVVPKKQMKKRKANAKIPEGKAVLDNNIILAEDVKMSLDTYFTQRNLNVLIVGGAGAGKTRYVLLPNLLNANTSFVITDPKGEILRSTGNFLKRLGYKLKVFNLYDMKNSSNYNPFNYVYNADGSLDYNAVKKMINVLMKNIHGGNEKSTAGADPFWDTSAEKLITAITILLLEEGAKSQQNFATVAEKMRSIEFPTDPKEKNFKSTLDKEFDKLEENNPNSLGVLLYREFKQGSGKTLKSVISVANSKLQNFNYPDIKNLTHCDTFELEKIGDEKTAFFIIISPSDTTFNFLAAMMYTQMFDILYSRANFKYGGRLPIHVRFLLDEFANVGQIPDFDNLIATMRSMGISVNIIIQAISQLKKLYEKSWEIIVANCDEFLFLGGQEETTLKLVSEKLGKETIDLTGKNRTKGRQSSTSENNSILGRELLLPDEIQKMDNKYCILFVRGYNPFYCLKYDLLSHPNYRYTEQANPIYAYDFRNIKTLSMPKLTKEEKAEKIQKLHSFTPEVSITVKNDIQTPKQQIITIDLAQTLSLPLKADKITAFDNEISTFSEENTSEIDIDKGNVYEVTGGKLYDLDVTYFEENFSSMTAEKTPDEGDFYFSGKIANSDFNEDENILYNM